MVTAERIRLIIEESGIKQQEIALRAGWDPAKFAELLNGKRPFKAEYLPAICAALNRTPADVIGYDPCRKGDGRHS